MKVIRTAAMLLCVVFISSFASQAKAADNVSTAALEQCASELSQCTAYSYYKNENTERYVGYRLLHPDYTLDAIISYVNIGLDREFYTNTIQIETPGSTNVLVNKYRYLPPGFVPTRLETISTPYRYGTQKLTHYARLAFEKLCAAAKTAGYPIWAVSSYRTQEKQAEIYASYLNPNDPNSAVTRDLLVAKPGFSEHQTGLAVDISRVDATVKSAGINKWLANNAYKYGFIIRYPGGKENVTGVTNEPWHLRYLSVKLATAVYKSGWTYDEYYARYIDIPAPSGAVTAIGVTASANVIVDGVPYQLSVYRVLGDTYYKLRDIAVILNGTSASFDITWNSAAGRVDLQKGVPYASDPTLGVFEAGHAAIVTASKAGLLSGETPFDLSAYVAGGSNYLKLGDILTILGLSAADDGTGTLSITTPSVPASGPSETPPIDTPVQ